MTALNIRKNTAQLLKLSATAIENAKRPKKADVLAKVNQCRAKVAFFVMPKNI